MTTTLQIPPARGRLVNTILDDLARELGQAIVRDGLTDFEVSQITGSLHEEAKHYAEVVRAEDAA